MEVLCGAVGHLCVRQLFAAACLQDPITEGREQVRTLELTSISVHDLVARWEEEEEKGIKVPITALRDAVQCTAQCSVV